jgi:cellulose biosynthesis protein BcsQ
LKLLSAFGNQYIQDNLKKTYPELEFLLPDLGYQEGILDVLQNSLPDAILVNMNIECSMDNKAFIEALRGINETVKVILIVKKEDKEFANWLVSKGVYDAFVDGRCTFDEIFEALKREQKVIIKREVQKEYVQKEKIITKEKVIKEIIPVNFKKLVLSIWGSSEFGCELSYSIARLTNNEVLLVDLDGISQKVDIYLGLSSAMEARARDSPDISPLDQVIHSIETGFINRECLEQFCITRNELPNLYVLSGNSQADCYEKVKEKELTELIEQAYRLFDIVILLLNPSVYDPLAPAALMKSDYIIAAFQASADNLRDFENYLLHMKRKYNLPLDRIRYVAYEYKENVHYPIIYLKEIFSGNGFLGTLTWSSQRELYRNLNASYARWAVRKKPDEYISILSKFNIVPQRLLTERVRTWTERRLRSLKKAIPFKKHK